MSWVCYKVIKAIKLQAEPQAGKGTTEKRAGRMACSAEAFFCLDFFWYFFVSRQKRTSLRGNERARVRSEPKVPACPKHLSTCHDSEARQSRILQSWFARRPCVGVVHSSRLPRSFLTRNDKLLIFVIAGSPARDPSPRHACPTQGPPRVTLLRRKMRLCLL